MRFYALCPLCLSIGRRKSLPCVKGGVLHSKTEGLSTVVTCLPRQILRSAPLLSRMTGEGVSALSMTR